MPPGTEQPRLRRSISLPLLIAYGVGTMVGGGFYALLGRVAHHAGLQAPIAMVLAAGVAGVTAISFCELSSRWPYSAGESRYVHEAFGLTWLSIAVGWAVIATGVVSAATLTTATAGFIQDLTNISTTAGVILFVLLLTGIAVRGILESVWVAAVIMVIEVGGLIWVLASNASALSTLPEQLPEMVPDASWVEWSGILTAAFLSFYAFIGFEDMVNEAEEVRDPRRTLPRGILWALCVTTLLYLFVLVVCVLAVPVDDLARSRTPLSLLVSKQGEAARIAMTLISLLAGVNGALVQIVMASRVAYGMSDQGMGPRFLATVHPTFRTPIYATLLIGVVVLCLALWLPLELLAQITSGIMLANFTVVNASLIRLKITHPETSEETQTYPIAVPILGCLLCLLFVVVQLFARPV